jgi:hypothetical protein
MRFLGMKVATLSSGMCRNFPKADLSHPISKKTKNNFIQADVNPDCL